MNPAPRGDFHPTGLSFSSRGTFDTPKATPKRRPIPLNRITAIDLRSRTEKEFISAPDKSVYHPFFSWDDRWVVFKKELEEPVKSQIMIAPVHDGVAGKEGEWIVVTDGRYNDDKPQFSPDGNTVYFTSSRDGYFCIWAQRLDPATKRPVGEPHRLRALPQLGRAGRCVLSVHRQYPQISASPGTRS